MKATIFDLLKYMLIYLVCLSSALLPTLPATAGTPVTDKAAETKSMMTLMMTSATSLDHMILMSAVSGGATANQLSLVYDDMKAKLKGAPPHKITLSNDEFFVGGKDTGVHIRSYSPLNVTYKGKTWLPDRQSTFDQSYFSLVKFFGAKSTAKEMNLLIPTAHAAEDLFMDVTLGASFGWLVGMMAIGLFGPYVLTGIASVAVVGGLIGLAKGLWGISKEEQAALVSEILKSEITITCDPYSVEIGMKSVTNKQAIKINKEANANQRVKVLNSSGSEINNSNITEEQSLKLYDVMKNCNTPSDAALIENQLKHGLRIVGDVYSSRAAVKAAAGSKATN